MTALAILCAPVIDAQEHGHAPGSQDKLGSVHFPTSCAPRVASTFDRAIALLHSFEFGAAIRTFERVLADDSACAMARWGIALSQWTNPMVPDVRPAALLAKGRRASRDAMRFGRETSARERGYIVAVAKLFDDYERVDQRSRVASYRDAMARVAADYPDDTEARIFHALAVVAAADPADKTYASQLRAGAMLEQLFASAPDHPGLAHYIIHSYDYPALAARAAAAARRYADIAPSAAHALHMPSHTFTRVGMWKESVRTNMRSMDVALAGGSFAEALHGADYAVYANLQMRRDSAARALIDRLPEIAARFDPDAVTGAAPGSAGVFALSAIPARYALERDAWRDAAGLQMSSSKFPWAEAMTHLARGIGAARIGDLERARSANDSLAAIQARVAGMREPYWAEQIAIQHLSASAWLELARGRPESALRLQRDAAAREDATEKAAVSPGPLAPARELLADMLFEHGRFTEALAEYRASLVRDPGRFRSIRGAIRAAAAAGDTSAAAEFQRELDRLTAP
jgi:hypothetical protein